MYRNRKVKNITTYILLIYLFSCNKIGAEEFLNMSWSIDKEEREKLIWKKIETSHKEIKIRWDKVKEYKLDKHKKQKGNKGHSILRKKKYDYIKDKKVFRSVSRNIVYNDVLYPELSFWIPSSFKHYQKLKYTVTGQILGNPTNRHTKDRCSWDEYWSTCADTQFMAEITPFINKHYSFGISYSQQESFIGNRFDGNWNEAGQALGFQVKTNIKKNQAISIIGNNLYNPYGKGGPNGKHPETEVQADLGRSYLLMYSLGWDIGKIVNRDNESLIAMNIGLGNGRYKTAKEIEKNWINQGKLNTIYSIGIAINRKISFFIEDAGQYSGIGSSLRPMKNIPLTATIMFRDFKGAKSGIINCKDGNIDNCRKTIDGRLVYHF